MIARYDILYGRFSCQSDGKDGHTISRALTSYGAGLGDDDLHELSLIIEIFI